MNAVKQPDAVWEARCRRCGRCCYEKLEYRGAIYYTDVPCEHLDLRSMQCRVYSRRHIERPGCAPLSDAVLRRGILPADCPYVTELAGYRGPRLWEEPDP